MNVLVNGSTGFVGTWMRKTLPNNVWAMGVGHQDYLDWEWELFNWDAIVHLAPISPSRVLAYAKEHKTRVLFASSGAVYEGQGKYADDKRAWEKECQDSGVDCVVARLFATSGLPFQKNKALSIFIQAALKDEPLEVWGNGRTVRSYLYGEDVGRAFWEILLNGNGTYDVGSTVPFSMLQVAELVQYYIPYSRSKIKFVKHKEMPTPVYYVPKSIDPLVCKETVNLYGTIERMVKNEKNI